MAKGKISKQILETGLFDTYHPSQHADDDSGVFVVKGMSNPFCCVIYSHTKDVSEFMFWSMKETWSSTFEQAWDDVPIELQKELIYHLDLFQREKNE